MSKKVKRAISLIIAAIMLLSTMSVLAFAKDVGPHNHVADLATKKVVAENNVLVCDVGQPVMTEVKEEYAQPTCTKAGLQVFVSKCAFWGVVLERKEIKLDKLTSHVPAAVPVIENVKKPTCKGGSYDEVIYCRFCNKEIERTTVKVAADINNHVAAPAIVDQDNGFIAATCAKAGQHYSVIYCKLCSKELSRTLVIDPPLGYHVSEFAFAHTVKILGTNTVINVPANKFVKGNTRTCADGAEKCVYCGKVLVDAIPHVFDNGKYLTDADKPTATKWGTKTYTCLICGGIKEEPVPPKGVDLDKGDVNASGKVDPEDARLILRFAIGFGPVDKVIVNDELIKVADIDGSGDVEPADARLALRLAVGLRNDNV